jgi:multicomponent Na+:H+ antiporter subunit G
MAVKAIVVDALLAAMVVATWIGVAGFARFRTPLDRLHCVSFVNLVAGIFLTVAAFISDGLTNRSLTVLFLVVLGLLNGAATAHATGRAFLQRREHRCDR